ncbi:1089_t:CDS:1, partial [Gigaspora rosea]
FTLQLVKDNLDFYYVKSMHTLEFFNVLDVNEILNLQENSKVEPNCYLLFKRQIQLCVSNIWPTYQMRCLIKAYKQYLERIMTK